LVKLSFKKRESEREGEREREGRRDSLYLGSGFAIFAV
jgi:hypothetical protein